jgi:hypothetical protein
MVLKWSDYLTIWWSSWIIPSLGVYRIVDPIVDWGWFITGFTSYHYDDELQPFLCPSIGLRQVGAAP